MGYCPNCGQVAAEDALFCVRCGRTVVAPGPPPGGSVASAGLGVALEPPPAPSPLTLPPPPANVPPPDWIPPGLVGKAVHCPRCNTLISPVAVVCPVCQARLPGRDAVVAAGARRR